MAVACPVIPWDGLLNEMACLRLGLSGKFNFSAFAREKPIQKFDTGKKKFPDLEKRLTYSLLLPAAIWRFRTLFLVDSRSAFIVDKMNKSRKEQILPLSQNSWSFKT